MAHWAVVVPADRYDEERLYERETVELRADGPQPGDDIVLVAATPQPVVFGFGRVGAAAAVVEYTRRLLDSPLPADGLAPGAPGMYPLDERAFAAVVQRAG